MNNAIELNDVCIDYPLDANDSFSLKRALFDIFSRRESNSLRHFRALDHVSLQIKQGERVGIIGLNGAGKSTLLRVMCGIFEPTSGYVKITGKVSPLLDFATGLELHHTGIENIRIRLLFLGESLESIEKKIPEIARFAELGDFLYQPARTYSTGMFMRLAFAASTSIEPEILIADEVVGAGDAQFADKAKTRLDRLLLHGNTTILSSHSMELIKRFCDRAIWLKNGRIEMDGLVDDVAQAYEQNAHLLARGGTEVC